VRTFHHSRSRPSVSGESITWRLVTARAAARYRGSDLVLWP
jgi:hypothetical protein